MSLFDALIEMSTLPSPLPILHFLFLALPAFCWCPKQMFSLPARQHAQAFRLSSTDLGLPGSTAYLPCWMDGGRRLLGPETKTYWDGGQTHDRMREGRFYYPSYSGNKSSVYPGSLRKESQNGGGCD